MRDAELVRKVWDFVIHDIRFATLGLRGSVREICREVSGSVPTDDAVTRIVRDFWEAWDEYHAKPSASTIGGGSPFYNREGELSPWQENAIRILEEGRDV